MNKYVKEAIKNTNPEWDNVWIPDLEIGDVCTIADVWDGDGELPDGSYCHVYDDTSGINYEWEVLQSVDDDPEVPKWINEAEHMNDVIRITDIYLI